MHDPWAKQSCARQEPHYRTPRRLLHQARRRAARENRSNPQKNILFRSGFGRLTPQHCLPTQVQPRAALERKMKLRTAAITASTIATSYAAIAWADLSIRPGLYQTTAEMHFPGNPSPMKLSDTDCVTPEEAAQDLHHLLLQEIAADGDISCTVENYRTNADKLSFDTVCDTDEGPITSTFDMKVEPNGYSAVGKSVFKGQVMTIKTTATRIAGTCTDDEE
jgi:hypothetical protein